MSETIITYSELYSDDTHDFRIVHLPRIVQKTLPYPPRLLNETEWRSLGVQASKTGWENYAIFKPEPGSLLLRRPKLQNGVKSPEEKKESNGGLP